MMGKKTLVCNTFELKILYYLGSSSSKVPNFNLFFIHFQQWNNNILQLGIILNNEASVFESFFQILDIVGWYFSEMSMK
jgi:hypothetical protein